MGYKAESPVARARAPLGVKTVTSYLGQLLS